MIMRCESMMCLGSFLIRPWLPSHRESCLLDSSSRLKQPDGPIGTISKVLATHRVDVYMLNLLSVSRLVELLAKVVILHFEIIVLAKEVQARFVVCLIGSVRDGCIGSVRDDRISQRRGGIVERKLLEFLPRWFGVLYIHVALGLL